MSLQIKNSNTVNNQTNPAINTVFKANPVMSTNTLERTVPVDTLVKSTNKNNNGTVLKLAGVILAGVGIFFAVKKGQSMRVEKAFSDLRKDLPRAQKTFQEVFLREDITEKEALEMINRYENIWKIKDKKEYIEALFKEARKNYKLDGTNIKLAFDLPCEGAKNASGFYSEAENLISIKTNESKRRIMNVMHHEFRHVLQHRAEQSSDVVIKIRALMDFYIDDYIKKNPNCNIKTGSEEAKKLSKEFLEKAKKELREKGFPETKDMKARYDSIKKELVEKGEVFKVPERYSEWVEKCAEKNYLTKYTMPDDNHDIYYEQFTEQDARMAGEAIAKLFGM